MSGKCFTCGETITPENTVTKDGWKEAAISGTCEFCFDKLMFGEIYENLEILQSRFPDEMKVVRENDGCYLAGGAMRTLVDTTETVEDLDLFFSDHLVASSVKFQLEKLGYRVVFTCPAGELVTLKRGETKVQLILKEFYDSLDELISTFDILACCAGYDGSGIVHHKGFITSVLNKIIAINHIEYPLATLKRVVKYGNKGYTLRGVDAEVIFDEINNRNFNPGTLVFYID